MKMMNVIISNPCTWEGIVSVARVLFSSVFSQYLLVNSTVVSTYFFFFPSLKLKILRLKTLKFLPNACTCNYSHKCSLKPINV